MKQLLLLTLFWVGLLVAQPTQNLNKVSSALENQLLQAPDEMLVVSLLLVDRVDMLALEADLREQKASLSVRSATTIGALKQKARQTQTPLLTFLRQHPRVDWQFIRPFWVNNVVFVRLHPDIIPALNQRADIEWIDRNYDIELEEYEDLGEAPLMVPGGRESGLDAIRAPLLWKLGYTGKDRVAMSFDTGVDDTHPALVDRHRANVVPDSLAWFDANNPTDFTPNNCGDHGTHTVGTMVGVNPLTNDTTGVAPQGYWIGTNWCGGFGQATSTAVFQWALDPDGDSTTTFDMPDVINNSWRHVGMTGECNSFYVGLFQALESAGISVVYSAGNSGSNPSTITPPKNINTDTVDVFSVGNLNGNNPLYPISGSSSRGPSICGGEGSLLIKPEVSAPGVAVRSTELNGTYGLKSGTSMAAPHVSGAILLLRDAFPYLTSRDLKMALYTTARDLGPVGEDNDYGMGLIDVFTAYLELVADGNVPNSGTPPVLEVALQGMLAPAGEICANEVNPVVRLKNYGSDTITSLKIASTYSTGLQDTLVWNGIWAPATVMELALGTLPLAPANYELNTEVIEVNGGQDFFDGNNVGRIEFTLLDEPVLAAIVDTVCQGADALLESQTQAPWQIQWYTDINGGFPIASGDQFTIPNLGTDTLLYIGSGISGVLGLADTSETDGEYYGDFDGEMYFTLDQPATMVSLDMVAETQGLRFVQVFRDVSPSPVIEISKIVILDTGKQTISIDEALPLGDYIMTISGMGGVYRQTAGISYPMEIPGLGSITGAGPTSDAYYYFYNIRFLDQNECPRMPVSVTAQAVDAVAAFTLDNSTPELPDNASVQFTDGSSNALSWFWDFGDSTTSTDQNPQHGYTQPGTYAVSLTVTDENGCSSTTVDSLTVTGFPTDIEQGPGLAFSVYPNPGSTTLLIDMTGATNPIQIEIWNVEGRRLLQQDLPASGKLALDMSTYADGIYLIVAGDGQRQQNLKWVKQTH